MHSAGSIRRSVAGDAFSGVGFRRRGTVRRSWVLLLASSLAASVAVVSTPSVSSWLRLHSFSTVSTIT